MQEREQKKTHKEHEMRHSNSFLVCSNVMALCMQCAQLTVVIRSQVSIENNARNTQTHKETRQKQLIASLAYANTQPTEGLKTNIRCSRIVHTFFFFFFFASLIRVSARVSAAFCFRKYVILAKKKVCAIVRPNAHWWNTTKKRLIISSITLSNGVWKYDLR